MHACDHRANSLRAVNNSFTIEYTYIKPLKTNHTIYHMTISQTDDTFIEQIPVSQCENSSYHL